MSEKRFRFEKECTENFFTEKGVFYNNERPMNANEIIALLNSLSDENEQLKERNEKLQWELDKTREDLNYFTNSKITAIRGSDCGHDRCYVTSMQKKR